MTMIVDPKLLPKPDMDTTAISRLLDAGFAIRFNEQAFVHWKNDRRVPFDVLRAPNACEQVELVIKGKR